MSSDVNGSALTMEPEGGVEVLDEVTRDLQIEQLFDGNEDLQRCESEKDGKQCLLVADHDAAERDEPTPHLYTLPEPIDPDADDDEDEDEPPTIEEVKAGLQAMSGGVASAQDIENAARAEEGLPPRDVELPLDFGPFNPDAALKSIFDKEAEVSIMRSAWERKKESASDAKKEYEAGSAALLRLIESFKNRRQQALNPSQPYLQDVSGQERTSSACPWEREHPGQDCPVCSEAKKVQMIPAVESAVHPEHEAHGRTADAAFVVQVKPLADKLAAVNIYIDVAELVTLNAEDLQALESYATEPTTMPPHILARTCCAAEPGSLIQVCQQCERVLKTDVELGGWFAVNARVGLICNVAPPASAQEETPGELVTEPESAPRKPRSHAKKNRAAKTQPEVERKAQSDEGRRRATAKPEPKKKAKKAAKGKK